MSTETWKDVINMGGKYSVSTLGRVRSNFGGRDGYPRILAGTIMKQGYRSHTFIVGGSEVPLRTHRVVAMAFLPNPEGKEYVNHKNGIKLDCCVDNLEWVTAKENACHAVATGLFVAPRGSVHHAAKLDEESAVQIRARRSRGEPGWLLAKEYGVSQQTVCDIYKRRGWRAAA